MVKWLNKERELNSAATLASQPAAGLILSFIITIVIMTLGWSLFVRLATESCGQIGSHANLLWISKLLKLQERDISI